MRISAKDALMHPYFRPLRKSEGAQNPAQAAGSAEKAHSASNGNKQSTSLRGSGDITFQK
jgi:hypothetical protein